MDINSPNGVPKPPSQTSGPAGAERWSRLLTAETLLARWQRLPPVDYPTMRAELDEVMDPAL